MMQEVGCCSNDPGGLRKMLSPAPSLSFLPYFYFYFSPPHGPATASKKNAPSHFFRGFRLQAGRQASKLPSFQAPIIRLGLARLWLSELSLASEAFPRMKLLSAWIPRPIKVRLRF